MVARVFCRKRLAKLRRVTSSSQIRGVIFDIDPEFSNTEEWYQAIPAERRPHKYQPFYHLFAEGELPRLAGAAGLHVGKYFRSTDNYVAVVGRRG